MQAVSVEEFFEAALKAYHRAPNQTRRRSGLGPFHIEFHIAGGFPSRDWGRLLATRPPAGDQLDATVYVWDDSQGCTDFPRPPWSERQVFTYRGDLKAFRSDRFRLSYSWDLHLLNLWDRERRIGLYWTADLGCLKDYEWAAPLRCIIHWIASEQGLQLTHAAAVGMGGKGVLLAGKGGSGKSTTSVACLAAGMEFLSDDYCLVDSQNLKSYAVYKTAKLRVDMQAHFPDWKDIEEYRRERKVFSLESVAPERLRNTLSIEALLIPAVAEGRRPGIRVASQRDAMASLALSTVGQLPGAGPRSIDILRRLTERVPAYFLDLCLPPQEVPPLVEAVLKK